MAIEALAGLLVLFALCWLFSGPWQSVWTDWYRQIVFEKRDELFDMARRGEISFNDPAYRAVRLLFEQSIRYAHTISLSQFVLLLLRSRNKKDSESSNAEQLIRRIESAEVREKIRSARTDTIKAMIGILTIRSPLGLLVILPLAAANALLANKPLDEARDVIEHDIELMAA